MGKRSDFEREEDDFYATPYEPVLPLLPFLARNTKFAELCCGDMALVEHLERHGHTCTLATDKVHRHDRCQRETCALNIKALNGADMIITNPPWQRDLLHPMIRHFMALAPTWLLFDADWMHTKQAAPFKARCEKIVSIGRVKWIADSDTTGMDNCCWYLFNAAFNGQTAFYFREESGSLL